VIAVDTSVVVAAFASWHDGHDGAAAALSRRPRIPAHVTRDRRAVATYERLAVRHELIG